MISGCNPEAMGEMWEIFGLTANPATLQPVDHIAAPTAKAKQHRLNLTGLLDTRFSRFDQGQQLPLG